MILAIFDFLVFGKNEYITKGRNIIRHTLK
jgi:hypothetical protein